MSLWQSARPRRRPWPDDIILGQFGFRLALLSQGDTKLIVDTPGSQTQVQPVSYSESARDPRFGASYPMRGFGNGFGEQLVGGAWTQRYLYTLPGDCSTGSFAKGPLVNSVSPGSTQSVSRFFEINGGLYFLAGRYCYSRTTDSTWVVSNDFGEGKTAKDVVVVQGSYTSSIRYAIVAMGDTEPLYFFDGNTWTQSATMYARALALANTEIYRVDNRNRVNICDIELDFTNSANWTAPLQRVGGYDYGVNRIGVLAGGSVAFFGEDDIYTANADGSINRLYETRQFPPSSSNGEAYGRWRDHRFVVYGRSLHRLSPDGGLLPIGPELISENTSPVRGYVTAVEGGDFGVYLGLYDPDSEDSFLLYGPLTSTRDSEGMAVPVWHGSLTPALTDVKITSMHVSSIGADTDHKRMWLGMSNGTIRYFRLPCNQNPTQCSYYQTHTVDADLYLPFVGCGFPTTRKAYTGIVLEGQGWTSTAYVKVGWATHPEGAFVDVGTTWDTPTSERSNLPTALSGMLFGAKISLAGGASTDQPWVSTVSLEYMIREELQRIVQIAIIAEDGLVRRDGTRYRWGSHDIQRAVELLSRMAGGVTAYIPEEETGITVVLQAPRRDIGWSIETRREVEVIRAHLVETRPSFSPTIEDLEVYTISEMEAFIIQQLEDI